MSTSSPPDGSERSRFGDPEYWSRQWEAKLSEYWQAPPRLGLWLLARYGGADRRFLECAAGSCSDSIFLASRGEAVTACDFDKQTLQRIAREQVPGLQVRQEDGFALSFADDSFDVVFHNGFWVCFDDDASVGALLKEQLRVSGKLALAVVHNAENAGLKEDFAARAEADSLYDIRFYSRAELRRIIEMVSGGTARVRFLKFGGLADRLFALARRFPFIRGTLNVLVPRLYSLQPWSRVERIVVEIKLP